VWENLHQGVRHLVVGKHKQISDEKLNLVRARVSHNEMKFEQKKYLYDS